MTRSRMAAWMLCAVAALPGRSHAEPPVVLPPIPAHPQRILVKYGPRVDACAHCLFAHGTPFRERTGSESLDVLHARLGVRRAEALFLDHHALHGGRSAVYAERRESARQRFPVRSARRVGAENPPDLSAIYALELPPGADPVAAAALYGSDPDVVYAEPDLERRVSWIPDDPFLASSGTWGQPYADLWGHWMVQAPLAWDVADGRETVVAVVDTGVRTRHGDLRANLWVNPGEVARNRSDDDGNGYVDDVSGWDFIRERARVADPHGHGTHVAGTIAATGDDRRGMLGIAFGARLMPLRALDQRGFGFVSDLAQAIHYAAQNGADVINNSWGGFGISEVVAEAVAAAADLGVVVVFAAGNDGRTGYSLGEANLPQVLAVSATEWNDTRASFSNYGDALSVAAPGADILSARGGRRVGGFRVTSQYVRLWGTSMAAPHVAGVAALLLSWNPALSTDEVRWHIELNADQLGHPGWEGQPWNPYLGWGRINAARSFDTPPVTTRLRLAPRERHLFAGSFTPAAAALDVRFTTTAATSWSFDGSPWLVPELSAGSGDARVALGVDATTLAPGSHAGTAGVSAAAASDGGGSVGFTAHVHRDERLGGEVRVVANTRALGDPPAIASNGDTTLLVWPETTFELLGATVDSAGNVAGPFPLVPSECIQSRCYHFSSNAVAVASDGADFLVLFRHYIDLPNATFSRDTRHEYVKAMRVSPAGDVLDPEPLVLALQQQSFPHGNPNYDRYFSGPRAAFDGSSYVALWRLTDTGGSIDHDTVLVRRIGTDGTLLTGATQVYPTASTAVHQIVFPRLACRDDGSCLVAWVEWNGGPAVSGRGFVRNTYGVRIVGHQVLSESPHLLVADTNYNNHFALGLAASPEGYAVLNLRHDCPSGAPRCDYHLIAARIDPEGNSLDPNGVLLNNPPTEGTPYARPLGFRFDGTSYVATFFDLGGPSSTDFGVWPPTSGSSVGYSIFAARFHTDGSVSNDEPVGLLVHPGRTALSGEIVASGDASVVVWQDVRHDGPTVARSFYAQRIFPR